VFIAVHPGKCSSARRLARTQADKANTVHNPGWPGRIDIIYKCTVNQQQWLGYIVMMVISFYAVIGYVPVVDVVVGAY